MFWQSIELFLTMLKVVFVSNSILKLSSKNYNIHQLINRGLDKH